MSEPTFPMVSRKRWSRIRYTSAHILLNHSVPEETIFEKISSFILTFLHEFPGKKNFRQYNISCTPIHKKTSSSNAPLHSYSRNKTTRRTSSSSFPQGEEDNGLATQCRGGRRPSLDASRVATSDIAPRHRRTGPRAAALGHWVTEMTRASFVRRAVRCMRLSPCARRVPQAHLVGLAPARRADMSMAPAAAAGPRLYTELSVRLEARNGCIHLERRGLSVTNLENSEFEEKKSSKLGKQIVPC